MGAESAMNLIYLAASLAGVGLLIGLNLLLMGRARIRVDAAAAIALLKTEYPDFRAAHSIVSVQCYTALIQDDAGAIYVVAGMGDKLVSRKLSQGILRSASRNGALLAIRFRDVTFPRIRFAFENEAAARDWEARIARLAQ